ncbi:ubiquitin-related modifier 1 homolog isoform X1 [Zea mays]|uniref:ubiquitin-related modifier 1 homolog isoform X1 n=1 Tax=Zea mays TaxID=4577 RepID=UPI0004DE8301|nr:ubiquitin-related modifier 1 homolog isoform X1 [Zea mays]|eukprot:XP_008651184.1 ubiquitin-related modifier 1 homolog isoform X1 [Zea mays]
MHLTLEFGGGLELLLENSTKVHKVEVTTPKDGQGKVTMKFLLSWVKENLIKERPEMFLKADSVQLFNWEPRLNPKQSKQYACVHSDFWPLT